VKTFKNLAAHIQAALETARFEKTEEGTRVYAEIPAFRGVWADGRTRKEAKEQLRKVFKGWIELQTEQSQPLPSLNGLRPPQLAPA